MIDEKKLIEDFKNTFSDSVLNQTFGFGKYTLLEAIEEMIERQPKTDWIPCEERLPSEATIYLVTEEVIVCSRKQYVVDIRLFSTENEWLCPINRKIIAWQPLPQSYKKEGAEND